MEGSGSICNQRSGKKDRFIKDQIEEKGRKIKTIIGGDFNARIGEKERRQEKPEKRGEKKEGNQKIRK